MDLNSLKNKIIALQNSSDNERVKSEELLQTANLMMAQKEKISAEELEKLAQQSLEHQEKIEKISAKLDSLLPPGFDFDNPDFELLESYLLRISDEAQQK